MFSPEILFWTSLAHSRSLHTAVYTCFCTLHHLELSQLCSAHAEESPRFIVTLILTHQHLPYPFTHTNTGIVSTRTQVRVRPGVISRAHSPYLSSNNFLSTLGYNSPKLKTKKKKQEMSMDLRECCWMSLLRAFTQLVYEFTQHVTWQNRQSKTSL